VVEPCPEEVTVRWPRREVVCAAFPKTYSFFKVSWESVAGRYRLPVEVRSTSPWKLRQGRYEKEYEAAGHPLTVVFDERSGRLVLAYDPSGVGADVAEALEEAFPSGQDAGPAAPMAGFAGVGRPERIEESYVSPEYPEKARPYETGARVTVRVLVRADGTVGDAELVVARPEGLGFGETCLEAVRQWRYRPARGEDGEPLDVWAVAFCEFEPL
jgi:TonB family protein